MLTQQDIKLITVDWRGDISFHDYKGLNEKEVLSLKKKSASIKGTLTKGDKVFFTKSSTVPRYKFAEYAKENDMSRVITAAKATAIVANPEAIVKSIVDNVHVQEFYVYHRSNFPGISNHSMPEKLYVQTHAILNWEKKIPGFSKLPRVAEKFMLSYNYSRNSIEGAVGEWNELEAALGTKKFVSDDAVLGEINQGLEITSEVYDQLKSMFSSTDPANISLAMELLANCDYKKSEFKVVLLLNQFYNSKMAGNKSRTLVNFKSLLQYFSKYEWDGDTLEFMRSVVKTTTPDMPDALERIEMAETAVLDYVKGLVPVEHDNVFKIERIVISNRERYIPSCAKAA